jgi:hypothetical protein
MYLFFLQYQEVVVCLSYATTIVHKQDVETLFVQDVLIVSLPQEVSEEQD